MTDTATLLLHGLGGCSEDWLGAAADLSGKALVPDAPYHGGRPGEGPLDFRALAEDAVRQLDKAGLASATVAGISMGAATAITMASLVPHRVRSLLLVAPAWLDTPFPANLKRLRKLGRIIATYGLPHAWQVSAILPPVAGWQPADRERLAARFAGFDPVAVAAALLDLPGELPVIDRVALAGFRGRTMVTGWLDDPIHPVDLAMRTSALFDAGPPLIVRRPLDRATEQDLLADWVRMAHALAERPDVVGAAADAGTAGRTG
ncbi:MAG TPA: alpha/beta fold hydrolase [Pseudonocardiaceae bacterium]|nr:alpha/beta fold hydrolase [Pseudonocardiaceae bacterium]